MHAQELPTLRACLLRAAGLMQIHMRTWTCAKPSPQRRAHLYVTARLASSCNGAFHAFIAQRQSAIVSHLQHAIKPFWALLVYLWTALAYQQAHLAFQGALQAAPRNLLVLRIHSARSLAGTALHLSCPCDLVVALSHSLHSINSNMLRASCAAVLSCKFLPSMM